MSKETISVPTVKPPANPWPWGYKSPMAPKPQERPITMENAIPFGFKIAIGMTLWFVPLSLICLFFVAVFSRGH